MDFAEFQAFGRTNPVFLAVGHRMQTKLRHKLFGRQCRIDQTKKRRDRYNFDKKFESDMEKYVSLEIWRYATGRAEVSGIFWVSNSDTSNAKKEGGRCRFLGRVPGGLPASLGANQEGGGREGDAGGVARTMRAELHGKLIKAVETLFGDARSLEGCFSRWKARCVQQDGC